MGLVLGVQFQIPPRRVKELTAVMSYQLLLKIYRIMALKDRLAGTINFINNKYAFNKYAFPGVRSDTVPLPPSSPSIPDGRFWAF